MDENKRTSSITDIINLLKSVDDREKADVFFSEFAHVILKRKFFGLHTFDQLNDIILDYEIMIFDTENDLHDWINYSNRFYVPGEEEDERNNSKGKEIPARTVMSRKDFMRLAGYKFFKLEYYYSMNRFGVGMFSPDEPDDE